MSISVQKNCWLTIACMFLAFVCGLAQAQETEFEIPDFDTSELEIELPEDFQDFNEGDFGAVEVSAEDEAAAAAVGIAVTVAAVIMVIIGLLLAIFVAYLLMDALQSLPEQYQQIAPWVPWLLLVPFVNLVVLIIAFIKVPDSLAAYLASTDKAPLGDCGKKTGLWGSILYVLGCTFPIGLVLLIISLMKISEAKKIVRGQTAS